MLGGREMTAAQIDQAAVFQSLPIPLLLLTPDLSLPR
jgi:hypothetical protein